MRDTDGEKIRNLYSYSTEEQSTFSYLQKYMDTINPRLDEIIASPSKRERFMLAGLFLTYRAFNHGGGIMTTDPSAIPDGAEDDVHYRRLTQFEIISGKRIIDMKHYLKLIHFSIVKLYLFGPARMLARFVLSG